jgi:hypothetical protein
MKTQLSSQVIEKLKNLMQESATALLQELKYLRKTIKIQFLIIIYLNVNIKDIEV